MSGPGGGGGAQQGQVGPDYVLNCSRATNDLLISRIGKNIWQKLVPKNVFKRQKSENKSIYERLCNYIVTEQQNRKILEELQQQKKRFRMTHAQPNSAVSGQGRTAKDTGNSAHGDPSEARHLQSQQKQALQHAHTNSFAYFTTQDSSFGNLILPVLPRLPPVE